jgi:hypothetical protein
LLTSSSKLFEVIAHGIGLFLGWYERLRLNVILLEQVPVPAQVPKLFKSYDGAE